MQEINLPNQSNIEVKTKPCPSDFPPVVPPCEQKTKIHITPEQRDIYLNSKIDAETQRAIAREDELEAEIQQAGKVDDVLVDEQSVVVDKVAHIALQPIRDDIEEESQRAIAAEAELSRRIEEAGKVDDVKVDGVSVVDDDKVANISLQPIRDSVNAEQQRAISAEAALSSSISSEASRAEAAEEALGSSIAAEQERAQGIEASLSTSISNESARAIAAEQGIAASVPHIVKGQIKYNFNIVVTNGKPQLVFEETN